ncbi:hypothetical protein CKO31_11705 [Thiohalocapsa halophila]|uniref:PilC beta-propeller domain-containing protein n=1 Tax=Thiohalocapsa halophila TaxID=69359 RepID=A0ABS1CHN6_9GAMM|nr:PilC/PilY family type IV pilus protein [Thiohalocapsa halophila]MBK1631394.1 hypothetical protein [Thiohalocapsa halophila]
MNRTTTFFTTLVLALGLAFGGSVSLPARGDDTEIFLTQFSGTGQSSGRPKVLILFDNSGSMGDGVPQAKPDYDPAIDWTDHTQYPGAPNTFEHDRIYWSFDGEPPIETTDRYIPASSNRCASALQPLAETGRYTDYLRVWREGLGVTGTETSEECECQYRYRWQTSWNRSYWQIGEADCTSRSNWQLQYRWQCETREDDIIGSVDMWRSVQDNDDTRQTAHMECATDIDENNPSNPNASDGWASDDSGPFRSGSPGSPWENWQQRHDGDLVRTLFTGNYLAWYYNDDLIEQRSKIEIAQDVVTELITNNPQVDFGLMVFNRNNGNDDWDQNGGRVVRHLARMEPAARASLVDLVDALSAETWTPLCETFYEAYRYVARPGDTPQAVYYGDDDSNAWPPRDACAEQLYETGGCESDGSYDSPMGDCENIYLVVMTDGKPTYDRHANSAIGSLLNIGACGDYMTDHYNADGELDFQENCMPALARHMFESDLDDQWENGNQRVITYTIGFLTDQDLLSDTAEFGGGTYYTAYNAHELADAFQATLTEILSSNTSFAAPAIAVDAYNRTKSLSAEYIAMFRPMPYPRWPGNLKKLAIEGADPEEVVDANGNRAVDPVTGNIKDTATTFWTTLGVDGMEVDEGGAGERLILRNPSTRSIFTNTGEGGALESFDVANGNLTAAMVGASDASQRANYIGWARGVDVRDEDSDDDTTDTRPWILGDVMHSTPEAINYGNSGPNDDTQDVRIVFGTNAGFVHMIDAQSGDESWAFFPKELGRVIPTLYENNPDDQHPYGVDGAPAVWVNDVDSDGNISAADGDRVLLFIGLRRGSSSFEGASLGYYALDVSDPDNPSFLWQVDQTDLPELGQSWSTPAPTFVPGYDNPVIVFGAGYDPNKDALGVGTADSVGRGIYVVDALDGSLVWSVTPADNSDTNLQEQGLVDSVPANVAVFDSNGDHVTDRMYFPDTGGNIWRVDLVDDDKSYWSIFKLASLGGNTEGTDRRFIYGVDIAVTKSVNASYEALLIGSGNRAHPLDRVVDDRFFMIRDTGIQSALHVPNDGDPDSDACSDGGLNPDGLPCAEQPPVITVSDLYDATDNLFQDGDLASQEAAREELFTGKGWFIELERTGEKSLSRSYTMQGRVFFTTYVPPDPLDPDLEYICRPSEGKGFLYAIGLHDATAQYDWNGQMIDGDETQEGSGDIDKLDRSKTIKDHIPDHPSVYFGEEIGLVGVGPGTNGTGIEETGLSLAVSPVYWMQEAE